MKVIAGKLKGKTLKYRVIKGLRVTSQKVKEAMFSILGNAVENAEVLDLFCGFGNLGIEAISRGAKKITFVDIEARALKQLSFFLEQLGLNTQSEIVKRDFLKALKHFEKESFDIIIMDPPYNLGYDEKSLQTISKLNLLRKSGIIVVEHSSTNMLKDKIENLYKYKEKTYGDTTLSFYSYKQPVTIVKEVDTSAPDEEPEEDQESGED